MDTLSFGHREDQSLDDFKQFGPLLVSRNNKYCSFMVKYTRNAAKIEILVSYSCLCLHVLFYVNILAHVHLLDDFGRKVLHFLKISFILC